MWRFLKFSVALWMLLSIFDGALAQDDVEDVGMTLDEIVDAMEAFTENCDPPPEREHVKQFLRSDENPDYESKCLRRCLMEQFEIIKENETTMNTEKTLDIMGMVFSDDDDALKEILETCNTENSGIEDRCENAHAHGMCTLKLLKEKGFKIPEIKE